MCSKVKCYDYLGNQNSWPVCRVFLKCKLYNGYVDALVAPLKCCSVLLGNIPDVLDCPPNPVLPLSQITLSTRTRLDSVLDAAIPREPI